MPTLPQIKIVRSHRRSLAIYIERDGTAIVKAPYLIPKRFIDQFILEHQDWITKHSRKIITAQSSRLEDEYLYLGEKVTFTPGNYTAITIRGDKLLFPQSLLFRKNKELTNWYISEASRIVTLQVEKYARLMKTEYREITFSDTRSQWGRCTSDNRLQFSWRLVMSPILVLNYVVIHELVHTMEKNHSQLFWMRVRNFNPSYRQQIKWLKDNGPSLHV
jgi:predicted metal-dependent hydrolase